MTRPRETMAERRARRGAVDDPATVLETAARLMAEHGTAHLIVASPQTGLPVGIVSTLDIARIAAGVPRGW